MNPFIISTDSASDLPESYLKEHNVYCNSLFYTVDGVVYGGEKQLESKDFYDRMRNGSMPTTAAINPEDLKNSLRPLLKEGNDILHLAFSSALSSSCQNAFIAANDLKEEFPDRKIIVIDTLSASLGEGFAVNYAVKLRDEGKNIDEIAEDFKAHINNFTHYFTVDDLFHLYRGGRVSKTAAVVGTLINIKPILHVDEQGRLIPLSKVRGRKKSLTTLVDNMVRLTEGVLDKNDCVFISHADCEADAKYVADEIKARTGLSNFLISPISPTIGAHTGPGCVALFFYGNARK